MTPRTGVVVDNSENQIIKGYQLNQQLGSGGFGTVYRATQLSVGREVAIKAILPTHANRPDFIRRFETEAQVIARLEHPYIVPLFDYWREPNEAYLVMRFLRGGSLKDRIRQSKLSIEEIVKISDHIASALALAHRNGIVHRDIKPDNILLDEDSNAFLSDFGIAAEENRQSDEEAEISGSIPYMSPEQITGAPPVSQTDIYALGIVIYEMLTGKHPFASKPISELLISQLRDELPFLPDFPILVNHIIQKATAKSPNDRYANILDFAKDLHAALRGDATDSQTLVQIMILNPYKGLRPFAEADAGDFFGRSQLIEQLIFRLNEDVEFANFLAIVGPSGSGKSSVVAAGLIPAVRAGQIPGSEDWFVIQMVPGNQPLRNLEAGLLSIASSPIDQLLERLQTDSQTLKTTLEEIGGTTLLVIDQFEEVFTLTESESDRARFLELLHVAVTAPDSTVRVVITLRADFTDRPLHYVEFGMLMRQRTEFVLPLSVEELEEAIAEPARHVGLNVESELIAAIIHDVRDEPGALPLLQYALMEVFERRKGILLSLEAYENSGGVLGALARRAQEVYNDLDEGQQKTARQIFLRLVTLGEGVRDTRRRAKRAELLTLAEDAEHVLSAFGKYRLLTFDVEPSSREPMVEVAHEALLRTWTLLQEWLDDSRNDIRLQRWLATASNEWEKSGRDRSYLLTGTRLAQYEEWRTITDLALTEGEVTYLEHSSAERLALEAAEAERQAREQRKAVEIQSLALTANARQTSIQNLPDIALSLAVEANQIPEPPDQVQQALFEIAPDSGTRRVFAGHRDTVWQVAISPDEKYALSASGGFSPATNFYNKMPTYLPLNTRSAPYSDNSARLWDVESGEELRVFAGHENNVTGVAFADGGQVAITASADATIRAWDIETGAEIMRLSHPAQVLSIAVHDNLLLASDYDFETMTSHLILWDLNSGQEIRRLEGQRDVIFCVAISPDGKTALSSSGPSGPFSASSGDNDIVWWNLETGAILKRMRGHGDAVFKVAFRPGNQMAVSASGDSRVMVWNLETGEAINSLEGHRSFAYGLAVSPDGRRAFSSSFDLSVILWDIDRAQEINRFYGHAGHVTSAKFFSDGRRVLTGSSDTSLRLWDVYSADEVQRFSAPTGMGTWAVATNEQFVLTSAGSTSPFVPQSPVNPLQLWDMESGSLVAYLGEQQNTIFDAVFLPDGKRYLTISGDFFFPQAENVMVLRDIQTDEEIRRYQSPGSALSGMALLPDGEHVATVVFGDEICIWNLESGEVVRRFSGTVPAFRGIAVTPDGSRLLAGSSLGILTVWDIETGEVIHQLKGHTTHIYHVSAAPDGRYALTVSDDTRAIVWDIVAGKRILDFQQHPVAVQASAISPNNEWALTGDNLSNLLLWELHTGKVLRRFNGHNGGIWSVIFTRSGEYALSTAGDGSTIMWKVAPQPVDELVSWTLSNRHVREFTCDERKLYRIEPLCPEDE